ncbi:major facilitator superfamily domain-containing protein [Lasiosphaeris hirsuta]|uniref:Major facilitator superfamily domain-containing protein n=1 Tax=Lasiosphaeris hirsuta TaxID=260670 RepID=A0AA40DNH4_9PEZI|nr:major facilitator superfamily domain-containing protein [Lasiosphaeris hirsuta]
MELQSMDGTNKRPSAPRRNSFAAPEYLSGAKLVTVSISITVVAFLMMVDISIISTAVPRITEDFDSLDDIAWYAAIYQLSSAAVQPLMGKIYGKFNTKWTFVAFFALFELGSALCGAAVSSSMLIVGRAVAGMGASGLNNGALTIVTCIVPLHRRPSLTGFLMGFSQLGIVLGPLLGGVLTTYASWRWCFYINLPLGALTVVGLLVVPIPDTTEKAKALSILPNIHHELDLIGFALFSPASVMLLLALQYGADGLPWSSPKTIGLFCGSGATYAVWTAWNWYRGDEALIPFSILKKRVVWSCSLTQWCNMTIVFSAAYFLPLYFQFVRGVSPVLSGVSMLPSIGTQLISAMVSGVLVEKTGYVVPYAVFAGVVGAVSNGLYTTLTPTTSTGRWIGYQILNGAGRGTGMQMQLLAVQTVLSTTDLPVAMGILVFSGQYGTAVMMAISNAIFSKGIMGVSQTIPMRYALGISHVFYMIAGVGAVSVFTSLFMGWADVRTRDKRASVVPSEV